MNRLIIPRLDYQEKQTLGMGFVFNGFNKLWECKTLELPWKDNKIKVSCISAGIYPLRKYVSDTHGLCFEIADVPGRTDVRIHIANYFFDLLGCIAPGMIYEDINKDGLIDVKSSKIAMDTLLALLPDETTVEIYGPH